MGILKDLKIIKHSLLRQTYFAELEETNDSDTFDSKASCPVCLIPDNYMYNKGFYMNGQKVHRIIIGVAAVAFVGYGVYQGLKKMRH